MFGDPNHDGIFSEGDTSNVGTLTNAQLAGAGSPIGNQHPIYMLGLLDAGEGIELAPGSVTDLSGASIRNPYASSGSRSLTTGRIVAGGTLATLPNAALSGLALFHPALSSVYQFLAANKGATNGVTQSPLDVVQVGRSMVLDPGSTLNLSGTSDIYDQSSMGPIGSLRSQTFVATSVWSDAGTLSAGAGLTLTGATIMAQGGALQANGGTLVALDPVLAQHDPGASTANVISADMIAAAGFDTLVALGSVSNSGDATIILGRGFFLETRPVINNGPQLTPGSLVPTLSSSGGTLTIDAPYVAFDSNFDTIATPAVGTAGNNGSIVFNATAIDFTGAMLIDRSVANATFNAAGDIRFTGVAPWQQTYFPATAPVATLNGMIAANGDLTFNAGQLYPTTGSTFNITTTGVSSPAASNGGTITFGRSSGATPDAPYSAGGNLTVQAANIVQGGVIRVPLGTLTLGGSAADVVAGNTFAPATQSVVLADGGITSVSADGLVIPYGTHD